MHVGQRRRGSVDRFGGTLEEETERGIGRVSVSEPYFLEVVPCAVDKANTLGVLLEILGVTREEVVAIGDGACDVTMLQLAGLGIAASVGLSKSLCRLYNRFK